jgi:DNA-binding IclR family transcriptional regulator
MLSRYRNGYAEDDQVFCPGLRCVAEPIKGPGGKVLVSVSVFAPVIRMEKETFIRSGELLIKYTRIPSEEIANLK